MLQYLCRVVYSFKIFSSCQISIRNLFKIHALFYDQWHIQPSELDRLPFYRLQYMKEDLEELLENKNKASGEEQPSVENMMGQWKGYAKNMAQGALKMPSGVKLPSGIKMPPMNFNWIK